MKALPRGIVVASLLGLALAASSTAAHADPDLVIDAHAWRVVSSQSGPTDYYRVVTEGGATFLRSRYEPPMKTTVVGWQAPDADRSRAKKVTWSWRAVALPSGGDECASGRGDSAAVVYLTWKRGLRYYTLKYVWSAVGVKGKVCGRKRNPFVAQDTVILESGGPLGAWRTESVNLAAEFRNHFEDGDPKASIPDFAGIALMSDGDQTTSVSSADFGTFKLAR